MIQPQIILDTHILLWFLVNPSKLSKQELSFIEQSIRNEHAIISSITLWEIAMLYAKQRITVYEPIDIFLNSISKIGIKISEITPKIAVDSVTLPNAFHGDSVDRIIVATTRIYSGILFTHDKQIIKWGKQSGYVKCNI